MKRRQVLSLLGGAALVIAERGAARAANPPHVGVLDPGLPDLFGAFFAGMRALGYEDGRNIAYERRSSAGRPESVASLVAELAQTPLDVVVTAGPTPVLALMKAGPKIPVVFPALGDAVGTGVTTSLAHPDRNATGLSFLNNEINSKRFALLHEMLPAAQRIAILYDAHSTRANRDSAVEAARSLHLDSLVFEVSGVEDFAGAFDKAREARAEAINILASPFFNANRTRLIARAAADGLPAMYESSEYVRDGGLISYGPDFKDLFRRAAGYVDRLLKGAKPADLPIEQPTKFDLAINLKTAKALGLSVPQILLAQADDFIE